MRALLLSLVLVSPLALAQKPDKKTLETAKRHFKKGDEYYAKQQYDEAIAEFKQAFELAKLPLLLFNIAQAYRLKGDSKQALAYYEDYLRLEPNTPSRTQVEQRIEELEKKIAEEEAAASPPALPPAPPVEPSPSPAPEPSPPSPDEPPTPGRGLRIAGIASAGAGVALITTSVLFALKARSYYDEVNSLSDNGGRWSDAQAEKLRRADRHRITAVVLGIAGGVTMAGGGVLYYLGWKAGREVDVAVVPSSDGALVTVSGSL